LLIAERLARHAGKRIAYIDTEYGTTFYVQDVPQQTIHPQAFDFEVLYTKAITQALDAVRGLDPGFGVLVIDSISHLWDSCKAAYTGRIPPPSRGSRVTVSARGESGICASLFAAFLTFPSGTYSIR
jgi:hypothetical protein